jgi:phosphoribosylanthranilate isomerase
MAESMPQREEQVGVKICGITSTRDALLAAELGASFIGLNFSVRSPRLVAVALASEIAAAVGGRACVVGVFVDSPAAEVERIAERVGLDLVQFSGNEGAAEVAPFAARAIKAFRTGGDPGAAALAGYAEVWGLLLDAAHPTLHGGTGEAWDYATAPAAALAAAGRRVFLAGGLGPDNVRRVVAACRPFAVDVCSRVESAPGIKDPGLLRRLFEEVRHGQAPAPS